MNTDKALKIDAEELSKVFYYDPTSITGLRWKVWNRAYGKVCRNPDDIAGQLYYYSSPSRAKEKHMGRVTYNRKTYPIHRIIWELQRDKIPEDYIIDHIDGNPFNNVLDNLRCIHSNDNPRNARKRKDNKTGLNGISIIHNGTGSYYVSAGFYDENKKAHTKQWALTVFTKEEALELAKIWRDCKIKSLEEKGVIYSARHGNES